MGINKEWIVAAVVVAVFFAAVDRVSAIRTQLY